MKTQCSNEMKRFTSREKVIAAVPFNLSILVGAYGLYLVNWKLTVFYLLYSYVGVLMMMRYTICPRCPHLLKNNDCLNMPPALAKKLISSKRQGPLNFYEKLLHRSVAYGMLLIPLYWLVSSVYLLIPFVVLYLIGQCTFRYHFCKNCQNEVCIQNRNPILRPSATAQKLSSARGPYHLLSRP